MHKLTISVLAIGALLTACDGGAVDRVDNRWDCRQICQDVAGCYNDDYDVDGCAEQCRDNANDDNDFEEKVDDCENCLDGEDSCLEDTTDCLDECAGVVAASS